MQSHPQLSTIPMSLSPPTQPLWSHTLQIIPSCTHSSKGHWKHWMALIFQLALLLHTRHTIPMERVGSHKMCSQSLHLTCTFAILGGWERSASNGGVFHDAHVH